MILEAFSRYLLASDRDHPERPSKEVLSLWLWDRLRQTPTDNIGAVIRCEVLICRFECRAEDAGSSRTREIMALPPGGGIDLDDEAGDFKMRLPRQAEQTLERHNVRTAGQGVYYFKGASASGRKLLKSLWEYSQSFEQQRWSRFLHGLKASDFQGPY